MYTFSNEKVKRLNDKLSREERSRVMSHIRVQSKLENKFSHALWQKGIRFRKNDRKLFGTPDISIKKYLNLTQNFGRISLIGMLKEMKRLQTII